MRIAFITQSYPPMVSGAALVVERLAKGMAERGHPVLVLAASDQGHAYTKEIGNLRIVRLTSLPNPKRANQHLASPSFYKVVKELKSFDPDIIHIHDIFLGLEGVLWGQVMKVPVIGTIHQLPWFVNSYLPEVPALKQLTEESIWSCTRWMNNQCDTLIVPTPTIAHTIHSEVGFKPVAISNGVDLNHFTPKPSNPNEKKKLCQKYNLDPSQPIILHVGRLDVDKNVEKVIEATAKTMQAKNAQLLVVGDGECKKSLQKQAKRLGIRKNCHFPGFISTNGDLPGIYRLANVFVTASEIETQGLVLLEALASGLPVVAVDATCIPELVKDNINGFLVQSNDVDAFADSLTHLICNPERARQMGQLGRELAEKHSVQSALDRHEDLYRKTITKPRKAINPGLRRTWTSIQRFL